MSIIQRVFVIGYVMIVGLFLFCGFSLIVMAGVELWHALRVFEHVSLRDRFDSILESIALLTIAVARSNWARLFWRRRSYEGRI